MKEDINNIEENDSQAEALNNKKKLKPQKEKLNKKADKPKESQTDESSNVVINVIEDEPFEDLSAFYNTKDIGVLDSEDDKKAQKPKKTKKIIAVILGLILLIGAGCGVYFGLIKDHNTYYTLYEKDHAYSNGIIQIEFEQLNILDSLLTYEFDEDYVYVALVYNFKNVSAETLDWSATPYMSMKPYVYVEGKGYLPMQEDSEEAKALLSALSSDVMDEIKDDHTSDIVDIDNSSPNNAPADDSNANDSSEPTDGGNVDNGDATATPETVELENNVLYGNFDFGALQIFALDYGVDFSGLKDDLAPGETRQSADVFKIRKELFDNNIFFIGADNLDAIFKIDLTPIDTTQVNNTDNADNANSDNAQ